MPSAGGPQPIELEYEEDAPNGKKGCCPWFGSSSASSSKSRKSKVERKYQPSTDGATNAEPQTSAPTTSPASSGPGSTILHTDNQVHQLQPNETTNERTTTSSEQTTEMTPIPPAQSQLQSQSSVDNATATSILPPIVSSTTSNTAHTPSLPPKQAFVVEAHQQSPDQHATSSSSSTAGVDTIVTPVAALDPVTSSFLTSWRGTIDLVRRQYPNLSTSEIRSPELEEWMARIDLKRVVHALESTPTSVIEPTPPIPPTTVRQDGIDDDTLAGGIGGGSTVVGFIDDPNYGSVPTSTGFGVGGGVGGNVWSGPTPPTTLRWNRRQTMRHARESMDFANYNGFEGGQQQPQQQQWMQQQPSSQSQYHHHRHHSSQYHFERQLSLDELSRHSSMLSVAGDTAYVNGIVVTNDVTGTSPVVEGGVGGELSRPRLSRLDLSIAQEINLAAQLTSHATAATDGVQGGGTDDNKSIGPHATTIVSNNQSTLPPTSSAITPVAAATTIVDPNVFAPVDLLAKVIGEKMLGQNLPWLGSELRQVDHRSASGLTSSDTATTAAVVASPLESDTILSDPNLRPGDVPRWFITIVSLLYQLTHLPERRTSTSTRDGGNGPILLSGPTLIDLRHHSKSLFSLIFPTVDSTTTLKLDLLTLTSSMNRTNLLIQLTRWMLLSMRILESYINHRQEDEKCLTMNDNNNDVIGAVVVATSRTTTRTMLNKTDGLPFLLTTTPWMVEWPIFDLILDQQERRGRCQTFNEGITRILSNNQSNNNHNSNNNDGDVDKQTSRTNPPPTISKKLETHLLQLSTILSSPVVTLSSGLTQRTFRTSRTGRIGVNVDELSVTHLRRTLERIRALGRWSLTRSDQDDENDGDDHDEYDSDDDDGGDDCDTNDSSSSFSSMFHCHTFEPSTFVQLFESLINVFSNRILFMQRQQQNTNMIDGTTSRIVQDDIRSTWSAWYQCCQIVCRMFGRCLKRLLISLEASSSSSSPVSTRLMYDVSQLESWFQVLSPNYPSSTSSPSSTTPLTTSLHTLTTLLFDRNLHRFDASQHEKDLWYDACRIMLKHVWNDVIRIVTSEKFHTSRSMRINQMTMMMDPIDPHHASVDLHTSSRRHNVVANSGVVSENVHTTLSRDAWLWDLLRPLFNPTGMEGTIFQWIKERIQETEEDDDEDEEDEEEEEQDDDGDEEDEEEEKDDDDDDDLSNTSLASLRLFHGIFRFITERVFTLPSTSSSSSSISSPSTISHCRSTLPCPWLFDEGFTSCWLHLSFTGVVKEFHRMKWKDLQIHYLLKGCLEVLRCAALMETIVKIEVITTTSGNGTNSGGGSSNSGVPNNGNTNTNVNGTTGTTTTMTTTTTSILFRFSHIHIQLNQLGLASWLGQLVSLEVETGEIHLTQHKKEGVRNNQQNGNLNRIEEEEEEGNRSRMDDKKKVDGEDDNTNDADDGADGSSSNFSEINFEDSYDQDLPLNQPVAASAFKLAIVQGDRHINERFALGMDGRPLHPEEEERNDVEVPKPSCSDHDRPSVSSSSGDGDDDLGSDGWGDSDEEGEGINQTGGVGRPDGSGEIAPKSTFDLKLRIPERNTEDIDEHGHDQQSYAEGPQRTDTVEEEKKFEETNNEAGIPPSSSSATTGISNTSYSSLRSRHLLYRSPDVHTLLVRLLLTLLLDPSPESMGLNPFYTSRFPLEVTNQTRLKAERIVRINQTSSNENNNHNNNNVDKMVDAETSLDGSSMSFEDVPIDDEQLKPIGINLLYNLRFHVNHIQNQYLCKGLLKLQQQEQQQRASSLSSSSSSRFDSNRIDDVSTSSSSMYRLMKLLFEQMFEPALYINRRQIGRGRFASVYATSYIGMRSEGDIVEGESDNSGEGGKVVDPTRYALKQVEQPATPYDQMLIIDLFTEISILQRMHSSSSSSSSPSSSSSGILSLLDFGVGDGAIWIVMPLGLSSLKSWKVDGDIIDSHQIKVGQNVPSNDQLHSFTIQYGLTQSLLQRLFQTTTTTTATDDASSSLYVRNVMKHFKDVTKDGKDEKKDDRHHRLHQLLRHLSNIALFEQVLAACIELEKKHVVHFDIKAENVLLYKGDTTSSDGDIGGSSFSSSSSPPPIYAVLADFGEAMYSSSSSSTGAEGEVGVGGIGGSLSELLIGGELISKVSRGTENIASPEVSTLVRSLDRYDSRFDRRRKNHADHASDVWSCGCLWYEVVLHSYEKDSTSTITSSSSSSPSSTSSSSQGFLFEESPGLPLFLQITSSNLPLIDEGKEQRLQTLFEPHDLLQTCLKFLEFILRRERLQRPNFQQVHSKLKTIVSEMIRIVIGDVEKEKDEEKNNTTTMTMATTTTATHLPSSLNADGDRDASMQSSVPAPDITAVVPSPVSSFASSSSSSSMLRSRNICVCKPLPSSWFGSRPNWFQCRTCSEQRQTFVTKMKKYIMASTTTAMTTIAKVQPILHTYLDLKSFQCQLELVLCQFGSEVLSYACQCHPPLPTIVLYTSPADRNYSFDTSTRALDQMARRSRWSRKTPGDGDDDGDQLPSLCFLTINEEDDSIESTHIDEAIEMIRRCRQQQSPSHPSHLRLISSDSRHMFRLILRITRDLKANRDNDTHTIRATPTSPSSSALSSFCCEIELDPDLRAIKLQLMQTEKKE